MNSTSARRLGIALIVLISVGYTIIPLVVSLATTSASLNARLLIVLTAFYWPHFLHVRQAFAGTRSRRLLATLAVQVVATYLPEALGFTSWSAGTAPLLAGPVLLLLPLRWGGVLVMMMAAVEFWWLQGIFHNVTGSFFYALTILITGAMIYVVVRLVRVTAELEQARADLAEAAVLKERLRISRDLHDGLGHSLTAIALKGDLASRLMDRDLPSAKTEVGMLVQVAREAAQEVRQVARGYRRLSLAGEVHRAAAMLESAGIGCQIDLAETTPSREPDEALAWAVREGVTNILRHSRATTCSITTSNLAGRTHLEIVNNGLPPDDAQTATDPVGDGPVGAQPHGGGLVGLVERAAHVGGTVEAGRTSEGGFRLTMEVPT
ncbi:sensor histidine kinase [Microbispora sp. RL4-1S]|uniref:Sensor histidine kinase n=1 Tax=Microbispora oryzae TaxID=2806554 RepID=A0A941AJW2_9ACTN|nr:sensor histidine kinase [Microbispora oryzae]MBP2705447.1 sensor histidine kinase [Microbispora oryzae]